MLYALCAQSAQAATIDPNAPKTITADKIEYNAKSRSIKTSGTTVVESKAGGRMTLTDAYLSEKGIIAGGSGVDLFLGKRTHVRAMNISKVDGITIAEDIIYTACWECDEDRNAWEISATRLIHDNSKHYMTFENPVFWIYDIPVFWAPFMDYPDPTVKHKSGLLMPYVNTTNSMGWQINQPVYVAFSDYHDLTFTPAYITAENPLWQLEHRLNADRSMYRTTGSYTNTRAGENRWHVFNKDLIELGDNARLNLQLERTSDETYLQKYGFYNSQPYLDSGGRAELFGESGYTTADIHIFQELRTFRRNTSSPSGDILPNIHGVFQTDPLFENTYASFMGDILGISNTGNGSAVQRMLGQASVTSPWTIYMGQRLTLSASARYDVYNFINTDMLDGAANFSGAKSRFLPSGYAEWAWPFINPGDDWIHVLEPRIRITTMRILDTPAFANIDSSGSLLSDATLFSDNRFSGYDLWENGTFIDYGTGWSAYSNGISVNAFAGQSFDFSKPIDLDPNSGFHYGASDYVARIGGSYADWLFLNNRFRLSQENMALRHLETVLRVGSRSYVESGYIYAVQLVDAYTVDHTINEVLGGFGVGLTERLFLRARSIYNITDQRIQRQNAGLYYDHPCYSIAFEYMKDGAIREGLGSNENYIGRTTFHLQFSLKLTEGKK